jgi:hypothetical protein
MNESNGTMPSIYHSYDYWLTKFGSIWYQNVLYLGLIPLGLIGFTLNILSYFIFRGRRFHLLSIYEYMRVYSLNSSLICLIASTRFIAYSKHFFSFSNSEWAMRYFINFFVPIGSTLILYQSLLDILLSFDRVVLFTNYSRFDFYRRIKPIVNCIVLLILSFVLMINFWLLYTPKKVEVKLSKKQTLVIHFFTQAYTYSGAALMTSNLMSNLIPLIVEIPLNFVTIIQLKSYINTKRTSIRRYHLKNNSTRLTVRQQLALSKFDLRTRKMEVRITLSIIIMSFTSIL